MSSVQEVFTKYVDQLSTTAETVRRRSVDLGSDARKTAEELQERAQELQRSLEPRLREETDEMCRALVDQSPIEKPSSLRLLLESNLWASVCLVAMSVGQLLGVYVVTHLLGAIFDNWVSVVLANVLLPLHAYLCHRKRGATVSEDERRLLLFGFSLVVGLLSGHNLSTRYVGITPPAFLLPLVVGLAAEHLGAQKRPAFLAASVGGAVAVYLVLGLISGGLGLSYLFYIVLYAAATVINTQKTISRLPNADQTLHQLRQVFATLTIQTILGALLGSDKPPTPQQ